MSLDSFSIIRHDLCTPINSIIGYSELIIEILEDEENTTFITELKQINQAGKNILKAINNCFNPQNNFSNVNVDVCMEGLKEASKNHVNVVLGYSKLLLEQGLLDIDDDGTLIKDIERIYEATHYFRSLLNNTAVIPPENSVPTKLQLEGAKTPSSFAAQSKIAQAKILVVDDNDNNRELLHRQLVRENYNVDTAIDGLEALTLLQVQNYDLILLDILMPQLNGYELLCMLKEDEQWQHLPVIMISSLDEIESVVKCIEQGADDYLSKPFSPVLLRARIATCLEKKRLRDQQVVYLQQISELNSLLELENDQLNKEIKQRKQAEKSLHQEKERSEKLLLNVLPAVIAEQLKEKKKLIADQFEDVTILFADLVGFTKLASNLEPKELVDLLNHIFSHFDRLAEQYGLEKIKTIGDAYMVVGGVPEPQSNHAQLIAQMALAMQEYIEQFRQTNGEQFMLRIGIDTGTVVAGVIGLKKFIYDLWGDTVNVASRMESHGVPGKIQVSHNTYKLLKNDYILKYRGNIKIKGKGQMKTYFLTDKNN